MRYTVREAYHKMRYKKGEIQMKKKFVVALVAAMSLTVAGTGTVFAMDKVSTIASEKEHVHGDNCEWVVDKEAWDETVHHPAEYKTVHHPAEYDTIHHPAEYDTIHHPEEGHMELEMHLTCNTRLEQFVITVVQISLVMLQNT